MRSRAYLSVQGGSFNVSDFQQKAGGQARRRKHSGSPLTNLPLDFWTSVEKPCEPHEVDAALSSLLTDLTPLLTGIARTQGVLILAHVVLEFDEGEEPAGIYFSEKTIQMLGAISAAIDVDAVPRLSGGLSG